MSVLSEEQIITEVLDVRKSMDDFGLVRRAEQATIDAVVRMIEQEINLMGAAKASSIHSALTGVINKLKESDSNG